MYTDKPLVLCSPTGSGKTAVFEMAIVRLMTRSSSSLNGSFKIVYSKLFELSSDLKCVLSKDGNEYKNCYSNIRMGIQIIFEYSGNLIKKEYHSV